MAHLELHTYQSDLIYNSRGRVVYRGTPFPHVSGVMLGDERLGSYSEDIMSLAVPDNWARQLIDFFRTHIDDSRRYLRYRNQTTSNCHGFADFMTGGTGETKSPDHLIRADHSFTARNRPALFGEHLALGTHKTNPNPDEKALRRRTGVAMLNTTYHSVIALGPENPDVCIEVTSSSGYLALDSVSKILAEHNVVSPTTPAVEWYTASPSA